MRLFRLLALLAALSLSFAAGALMAGMRHWFQPLATVHISNLSGQDVTHLVLTSRTNGAVTTTELMPLPAGGETTAWIFVAGEGSYQLQATLANGRVLAGGAGYVEGGYTATERLHPGKVESRQHFGF